MVFQHKSELQFGSTTRRRGSVLRACVLTAVALVVTALTHAQDAPQGTIGRVSGYDISVDNGATAPLDTATNSPSIFVLNGSVVTVHSGSAHMTLASGGQVDVCGPAKFTLLVAGGSITLALNFGRVHVLLPAASALRIYTPTIVATPIDISGNQRDITAGLDLNDSLCVRATSGALKLEQQFTGEDLIVPQSGEFFLANGKLVPVAGAPGACDCEAMQAKSIAPAQIPLLGIAGRATPAVAPAAPEVAENMPPASPANMPLPQQNVQLHVLQLNNDAHPVAPPEKSNQAPPTPEPITTMPEYKVIAPPLSFSASEPQMPAESPNEVALLVRTVHVEPEWQFSGRVQPPGSNSFTATSTPATVAQAPANSPDKPPSAPAQKKEGFWKRMKRAFGGS